MSSIPVASTNVILASTGATVTGGSGNNICGGSSKPMYCIDGQEDSFALVTEDSPLIISIGQLYRLSSLRMKIDANGNSYTIESSPDGESWQPVGGETKGKDSPVWLTFEFSQRVVLHFRVTIKQIHPVWNVCVYHFESPASK